MNDKNDILECVTISMSKYFDKVIDPSRTIKTECTFVDSVQETQCQLLHFSPQPPFTVSISVLFFSK
jgi:hypothetical protein